MRCALVHGHMFYGLLIFRERDGQKSHKITLLQRGLGHVFPPAVLTKTYAMRMRAPYFNITLGNVASPSGKQ